MGCVHVIGERHIYFGAFSHSLWLMLLRFLLFVLQEAVECASTLFTSTHIHTQHTTHNSASSNAHSLVGLKQRREELLNRFLTIGRGRLHTANSTAPSGVWAYFPYLFILCQTSLSACTWPPSASSCHSSQQHGCNHMSTEKQLAVMLSTVCEEIRNRASPYTDSRMQVHMHAAMKAG